MDSNEIFEQAKRDGFANIYIDTPNEVAELIKRYNEEMGTCRVNRKRAKNCETAFLLINPVFASVLCLITLIGTSHIITAVVTTLIFLAIYFFFMFVKRNMLVVSCAAATLLILGAGALILLLADLAIAVYHMNIDSELKTHDGYSAFNDLRLIYSDKKTPVAETDGE